MSRKKIAAFQMFEELALERKITLELDHPMILKVVKTFKDSQRVYFLMEYIKGRDMFDVIREINVISTEKAQFYIGCIMLMM